MIVVLTSRCVDCYFKQKVTFGLIVFVFTHQTGNWRFIDSQFDVLDERICDYYEPILCNMEKVFDILTFLFHSVISLFDDSWVDSKWIDLDIFLILKEEEEGIKELLFIAMI